MGRAREEDSPGGGNVSEADKRGAEMVVPFRITILAKMGTFSEVSIFAVRFYFLSLPIMRRMTSLSVPRMPSRAMVLTARMVFSTPWTTMPSPP